MDPNTFTFDVDRVLEGEVDATTEVESAMSGASCGWEGMRVGDEYVVFATDDHGTLRTGLCSGNRSPDPVFLDEVEQVTGPSEPAAPDVGAVIAAILAVFAFLS